MNGESSGEYLQKVMFQLQEFNVPTPISIYDRTSFQNRRVINVNENRPNYGVQRINMNGRENAKEYSNQSIQYYNNFRKDSNLNEFDHFSPYYQPQVPNIAKIQKPETLGFTKAELASMYKDALEKGSTISLSSLTNALSTGDVPQVTKTHVEFPMKQPLYQYYFFPLKTFMSEYKKNYGYKTIPAHAYDDTATAQTQTQTQLSNPIFVAISTFLTMAIVFMMSVLFLPKLTQLDILHSRGTQDDTFYLLNMIAKAIERYNILDKFKDHPLDFVR